MAWFIGQSAVMIVLAFLLGLLVGWIIWGRRVHALIVEVRELREAAAVCEADHGGAKPATGDARAAKAAAPAELVAGSTGVDTAVPVTANGGKASNGSAPTGKAPKSGAGKGAADKAATTAAAAELAAAGKTANGKVPGGKATDGKATNGKAANGKASGGKAAGKREIDTSDSTMAAASNGVAADTADLTAPIVERDTIDNSAATIPVHIPAPRSEMTEPPAVDTALGAAAEPVSDPVDEAEADDASKSAEAVALTAAAEPVVATDEPVTATDDVAADAAAGNGAAQGAAAVTGDEGPVDDLVRIEGIGPKIAAALVAAGIRTFRQLADVREPALTGAINAAGITFAPSLLTWSQQAQLLADDDEEGFLELTERLIAGRVVTAKTAATAAADPETPPDDLARIEGIGPKIAAALVAAGIRTFRQMARADDDTLTKAINNVGIKFAPSLYTWAEQAQLLADGDEEGFAVLTARLIAGRRPDDDLERIEGVDPKMSAALHAAGIRTYRALADSSDVRLRNAVTSSGQAFTPSVVTWSRQARLLADGDEEGFADLTRRLAADRDGERA